MPVELVVFSGVAASALWATLVFAVVRGIPRSGAKYWASLAQMERSLAIAGFGGAWVTRGHYVVLVAEGILAATLTVPVLGALLGVPSREFSSIGIAGIFLFACTFGVALIVARTGRPRSWIPPQYRGSGDGERRNERAND